MYKCIPKRFTAVLAAREAKSLQKNQKPKLTVFCIPLLKQKQTNKSIDPFVLLSFLATGLTGSKIASAL